MAAQFAPKQHERRPHAPHAELDKDDQIREGSAVSRPPGIVALQRYVGNSGVQRMLQVSQHSRADAIHRKGCACAACAGKMEDDRSSAADGNVQRWWDDDEESESDSDGGGSWFDDAADAVSDWVSGDDSSTTVADSSEDEEEYHETDWEDEEQPQTESHEGADDSGGSWWDRAKQTVSDWFSDDDESGESDSSETADDSGGSWWDEWWDSDESTELEEENDSSGTAMCASGFGGGSSGGVSVAGKTTADFAAATVNSSFVHSAITPKGKNKYDVTGTESITYSLPTPSISYTVTPSESSLNDCQKEKVNAFKAGDLGTHEKAHQDAFTNTFDGSESYQLTFTDLTASNTEELTAAVQAAEKAENKKKAGQRQTLAQAASDKLDPWSKPIPGIDKC